MSEVKIRPVIRGGQVTTVEVGDVPLALKRPIPLADFPTFVSMIERLSDYIDWEGDSPFTEDELFYFVHAEITDGAREFFQILAIEGDWVLRDRVLSILKMNGQELAGTLSSPGQYFSRNRKDPIYEKMSRKEEEGEPAKSYYRLKPKYLTILREVLDIDE